MNRSKIRSILFVYILALSVGVIPNERVFGEGEEEIHPSENVRPEKRDVFYYTEAERKTEDAFCGKKMDTVQITHKGRGFFNKTNYTLNLRFIPSDQGFVFDYDYGVDSSGIVVNNRYPNISNFIVGGKKIYNLATFEHDYYKRAVKAVAKRIRWAKTRYISEHPNDTTSKEILALNCALATLASMPAKANRSEYTRNDFQDLNPKSNNSDDYWDYKLRAQFTLDGPKLGLQRGPTFSPFDGSKPTTSYWGN